MFWLITGKKELDRCLKFSWLCHLQKAAKYTLKVELVYFSCWSRAILCTSELLKKWPFLLLPSTCESIPGRPLPRTRAFLGVFDNSRGVRDHGNFCCAAIRIMGKPQKRKGTWEGLTWKVKRRFPLFAPPLTPCAATATKNRPKKWLATKEVWSVNTWLLVSLFTSIPYIRCGYLHSFRCEWKKIKIPTICWPSSELNNKRSHVTNLPEGATQILLQTTCNHQILRTISYFQSAQKWKWILQDH